MADPTYGLSDAERQELEELRAEKERQQKLEQARKEREELERLRKQVKQAKKDEQIDARINRAKKQAKELMEPDDELHMPRGQKIVLALLFVIAVAALFAMYFH